MHTPKAQPNLDPIRQALEAIDAEETAERATKLPMFNTMKQQIADLRQQAANMEQQLQHEAYAFDLGVSGRERARQELRKLLPAEPEAVAESGQTAEKVLS